MTFSEMDEGAILLDAKLMSEFSLVDMVGRVVDRLLVEPFDTIQERLLCNTGTLIPIVEGFAFILLDELTGHLIVGRVSKYRKEKLRRVDIPKGLATRLNFSLRYFETRP